MLTSDKIDYKSSDSEINDPMLLSTKIETLVTESERKDAEIRTLMNERFELLTAQFNSRFAAQTAQFDPRFAAQANENVRSTEQLTEQLSAQAKENVRSTEQLTEQLSALQGTVLHDWIRNVAASILLVLAGEQPYPYSVSNRFQRAAGPFLTRVINYVTSSSQWEIHHFKRAADGVISRRNVAIHPVSLKDLDKFVIRAQEAIQSCPRIITDLKTECITIANYNDIKKCIPLKKNNFRQKIESFFSRIRYKRLHCNEYYGVQRRSS